MPLHLIKLCVGCDSPEELEAWRAVRRARGETPKVHTRQTPKRAEELLAGGSLYWVFKGVVRARQTILAVDTLEAAGGNRCEITLDDALVRVAPHPRRAFQGWRYLTGDDAPVDVGDGQGGANAPPELARQLRELGLL